jgi:hypothetical protein
MQPPHHGADSMMKCYIGGSTYPGDFDFIAACFAENKNEAKKILWNDGDLSDECEGEYLNLHVIRMPKHDNLFGKTGRSDAHVVQNNSICREMFFSMEGDSRCAVCGLAEYEGLWPLCENCEQCSECGHDDGCELGALL